MVVSSKLEMPPEWMKMDTISSWDVSAFNFSKISSLEGFYYGVDLYNSLSHNSGTNADILKVGGYKLSALEIEAVLLEVCVSSFYLNGRIEVISLDTYTNSSCAASNYFRVLCVGIAGQSLRGSCNRYSDTRCRDQKETRRGVEACVIFGRTVHMG